jgi:hypothetical protein
MVVSFQLLMRRSWRSLERAKTMIRIEIERRITVKQGRSRNTRVSPIVTAFEANVEDALLYVAQTRAAGIKLAGPDHMPFIAVRLFDAEAFHADPLKATPLRVLDEQQIAALPAG